MYRPRTVFEDLRERPSWLPPAAVAVLAATVLHEVTLVLLLLKYAGGDLEGLGLRFDLVVGDLETHVLWTAIALGASAAEYILSVLLLAAGTAILVRGLRLGAEFSQVRSVVAYSLLWVFLARSLLATTSAGIELAFRRDSVLRGFGALNAARLAESLSLGPYVRAVVGSIGPLDVVYRVLAAFGLSVVAGSASFRDALKATVPPSIILGIAKAIVLTELRLYLVSVAPDV